MALLVIAVGSAFGTETRWDFTSGSDGWLPWGISGNLTREDADRVIVSLVKFDAGGLKIEDISESESAPYAISPGISIQPNQQYILKGRIRNDESNKEIKPAIWGALSDTQGKFLEAVQSAITFTDEADESGWSNFEAVFDLSHNREGGIFQICIRPPRNPADNQKYPIWVSNLTFNENGTELIPLKKWMNLGFSDEGLYSKEAALPAVPAGRFSITGNTVFDIIDSSANNGNSLVALRAGNDSKFVSEIKVPLGAEEGAIFRGILLFHALAGKRAETAPEDKPSGYVDFLYKDGKSASVPIIQGQHVDYFWRNEAPSKAMVIRGAEKGRFYVTDIQNPYPDLPVEALIFKATEPDLMWLLAAATSYADQSPLKATINIRPDKTEWKAFVPGLGETKPGAVTLEFLLDAPAGKHGFVKVKNGHFEFEDGTPARFWGTNVHSVNTLFPTHENADKVAATLARYGCNIVRLHLPEHVLLQAGTRKFVEEEKWERFDYFFTALKNKGIYVLLDSISSMSAPRLKKEDGVDLPLPHGAAYYNPRMRELAHAYMKELLGHINQYTGKALAEDPALAMALILNEKSIFWATSGDWKAASKDMTYLQKLYNQWLVEKYANRKGLEKAWALRKDGTALNAEEDPVKGTVAFPNDFSSSSIALKNATAPNASETERIRAKTEVTFLKSVQEGYYRDIAAEGATLGLKVPMIGTNINRDLAELDTQRFLGVTSQNVYWDHVKVEKTGYRLDNRPEVVCDPLGGNTQLTEPIWLQKAAGTATTTTENDAMWPHEWRSSHLMMTGATAALQDADGVFQYAFAGGFGYDWEMMEKSPGILNSTVSYNDPATLSSFMTGAFLFLRGDVEISKNRVSVIIDEEASLAADERLLAGSFPMNYLPFVSRYELIFPGAKPPAKADWVVTDRGDGRQNCNTQMAVALDAALKKKGVLNPVYGLQDGKLISDTGQITRDWKKELFLVNTPLSQGFTGFPAKDAPVSLNDVKIESRVPFATVQVSSLDGKPLKESQRMFVIAVARADNESSISSFAVEKSTPMGGLRGEGMFIKRDTGVTNHNVGSVMIEPVMATLQMQGEHFRLTPLGPDMVLRQDAAREFSGKDGQTQINLGEKDFSVWYLLER